MNIIEIWKPVDGYDGLYEVSNLGRVKSLWYGREKILKPKKRRNGYLQVGLRRNGKRKFFLVHRLVAMAFIPNPNNYPYINHKDEVKTNNIAFNIEWCSAKYNANYGTRNIRMTTALSKPVEASKYPDFSEICLRFSSTQEAERNGYGHQNVSACCRGCYCSKGNFYRNLYWRFAV